jgi:hypothetical protein
VEKDCQNKENHINLRLNFDMITSYRTQNKLNSFVPKVLPYGMLWEVVKEKVR